MGADTPRKAALITAISCFALAATAASAVVLTIDPAGSSVNATLSVSIVSDSETLVFSGTMTGEYAFAIDPTFGLVVDRFRLTSADLELTDGVWALFFSFIVNVDVDVTSMAMGGTASSLLIFGTPVAMNTSEFELQGSTVTFDEGTVIATGSALGDPVDVNQDLSVEPLPFPFDNSTIATVVVTELGDGVFDIDITIPVAASVVVLNDPQAVTLTLDNGNLTDGQIVMSGTVTEECGNEIIDSFETCDDGNTLSDDGCSGTCQVENSMAVPTLGERSLLGLILLLVAVGSAAAVGIRKTLPFVR